MDFRIGGWLIGGRPNNLLILGDHLFLNYIFFWQLRLINPGGIINPHLTLSLKIFGQLSISAPCKSAQGALIFAIHA